MRISSSFVFILWLCYANAQTNNLKCSKVSTDVQAHPKYPTFGGVCSLVDGQTKFLVKYCSFPKNNITITENKVVQQKGCSYEYRCLFSEDKVYQQITGCVVGNEVLRNGQSYTRSDGKSFICIKDGSEWYFDEIQKTQSLSCQEDQDARGVRFACQNGKLEAIGCIDPFGLEKDLMKDDETIEFEGYYKFICKKDAVWGFKLQIVGCLDSKKQVIPIGKSITEENVIVSCETSENGQVLRQEKLADTKNGCSYYGKSYEEGAEFNDLGNMTVYKCVEGQLEKIACIVKTNRVNLDRIFYCFDHPYYCTPTGTGATLLQNNGCFNNGTLVKAFREVKNTDASFVCSKGPFDAETQTFTFTQTLSACIVDGTSISYHQYAKMNGKWMYCDESRKTESHVEVRELNSGEAACADKYGVQMSLFCVTSQNKEVSPELSDELPEGAISFSANEDPLHYTIGIMKNETTATVGTKVVYTSSVSNLSKSDTFSGTSVQNHVLSENAEKSSLVSHIPIPGQNEPSRPEDHSSEQQGGDINHSSSEYPIRSTSDSPNQHSASSISPVKMSSRPRNPNLDHLTTGYSKKGSSYAFSSPSGYGSSGYPLKDASVPPKQGTGATTAEYSSDKLDDSVELVNAMKPNTEKLGSKCKNDGTGVATEFQFKPSQLTEDKKKAKYADILNLDMCKMLSGFCLDWVAAEAIFQLSPENMKIKPLIFSLASSSDPNSVLQAVESIGMTGQFEELNEKNYHMRRLFNFTLNRMSSTDSQCRQFILQCFEGTPEGCTMFSKSNCVLNNACPLTESYGKVYSQPLIVLKPLVRYLCSYTCAQWLITADNELAAMRSVATLGQFSEKCMD